MFLLLNRFRACRCSRLAFLASFFAILSPSLIDSVLVFHVIGGMDKSTLSLLDSLSARDPSIIVCGGVLSLDSSPSSGDS